VWIALKELGIGYELIQFDKANKPQRFFDLYQRANPLPDAKPKVPVLHISRPTQRQGDIILCESTVISEYLAEAYGDHLMPCRPKDRATIRLFLQLCGSTFSSYVALSRVQTMQQWETELEFLKNQMAQVEAFLQSCSSEPFVMGNQFTLAECYMAPFVQRCCEILPSPHDPLSICERSGLMRCKSWIQAVLQRDSVIDTATKDVWTRKRDKLSKRLARIQARDSD
jgi:glutathione S-transferase